MNLLISAKKPSTAYLQSVFLKIFLKNLFQLIVNYDIIIGPKKAKLFSVGKSDAGFHSSPKLHLFVKKYDIQKNYLR